MTCAFGIRKLKINSVLDSEGFLFINNTYDHYDVTKTFKIGEITDTNGSIICPGEIVSIMDYEEFERNKTIQYILVGGILMAGLVICYNIYQMYHEE